MPATQTKTKKPSRRVRIEGGRVPQERINYIVERLIRVRNSVNTIMTVMNPYFQIPFRTRDPDQHLTDQQKAVVDRHDVLIQDLMEKIERRYRELCKGSDAFKNSYLARNVHRLEKLYLEIYREQWGGYALYDEISVETKLRAFHFFINRVNLQV